MQKTENLHEKDCIRTQSGIYVNVFNPTVDMINIEDIAHALSNLCRFGGHTRKFYSVAQHSILCSLYVHDAYKREALLHDAAEAYLVDLPSPIKRKMYDYQKIEKNLHEIIAQKFGLPYKISNDVYKADEIVLHLEWDSFVLDKNILGIKFLSSSQAKKLFLKTFEELSKK